MYQSHLRNVLCGSIGQGFWIAEQQLSHLSLFQNLRTLNWRPLAIGHTRVALAFLGRVEKFLLAEEAADGITRDLINNAAVELRNANFSWQRSIATPEDLLKTRNGFLRERRG